MEKEENKKYKKCKIEFVNDLESNIKLKTLVFKPSKMKEKQELRKMTEEYIDR